MPDSHKMFIGHLTPPKYEKSISVMQTLYVMVMLSVCIFIRLFGTVAEAKQMPTKDRLQRKKYMGVCR
jgi:hypothetical protein